MSFQKAYAVTLEVAPGADIPQLRFVNMTATGAQLSGDAADAVGVILEKFTDADFQNDADTLAKPVAVKGIVEVEVDAVGALAVGDLVACAATGTARVAAAGEFAVGVCTKAAAAGGFANVLLSKTSGLAQ